jgi:RimJ/RimL family protein N-acetyltransferase
MVKELQLSNEVTLKEFRGTLAECELISGWRNNPDNSRWFPKQDAWTGTSCWAWYNEVYVRDPSQNLYWVLRDLTPIGTVGMTIRNGSGELERMMLGDKNLARGGYMRQGMRQLMSAYGMNHYWLRVMPDNEATIRFHQRNGFTKLTTPGGKYENVLGEVDEYLVMSRSYDGYWPEVPAK